MLLSGEVISSFSISSMKTRVVSKMVINLGIPAITKSNSHIRIVRSMIFLYIAILPFLLLFLQYMVAETPFELIIPSSSMVGFSEVALYFMIYGAMALSLYLYYGRYYGPMDPGIVSGIRRLLLN